MFQPLAAEDRIFILSKVFQSVPLYFAHWEDASISLEQLDCFYQDLVPKAMNAPDRLSFSLLLMEFMTRLNNGHTIFRDCTLYRRLPLGFSMTKLLSEWVITSADTPFLMAGDAILHINGKSMDDWYDTLHHYTPGSTQFRRHEVQNILGMVLPDSFEVCVERDGIQLDCTISRGSLEYTRQEVKGCQINREIGYIRIPSFMHPQYSEKALELAQEYSSLLGLILDVRGNEGGHTPSQLISGLMNQPSRWWAESTPINIALHQIHAANGYPPYMWNNSHLMWHASYNDPQGDAYQGKMVILTDSGTFSAAEDFTMPFKDNGRALLVGSKTGGSTGQPFIFNWQEQNMLFVVGAKRAYMPDGSKFEGIGITPDVEVSPTREALYAGRDLVLEKAIELLMN